LIHLRKLKAICIMQDNLTSPYPPIANWRVHCIRFNFLLIAVVMGAYAWYRLLFESADVPVPQTLARAMLAGLALMSFLGVRYPIQMLPLMLYELVWKTVWIVLIAFRAWLAGKWTADIEALFHDCLGIVFAYLFMPWRYVWARYVVQPMEPLRRAK